ncbi:MAG: PEP/pyruvate-binding domain-containing protein [Patescibacteria group bacterium]|nr:hypothetical protein [Patescibacteria group bacterium]
MKQEAIYTFSLSDKTSKLDPFLLGNKGRNLCDLKRMNIQVPQGFVITTDSWREFTLTDKITAQISKSISNSLTLLEDETDKKFGDRKKPLIISTRSSSRYSMPGILDTILNIGINDENVKDLADLVGEYTAYDSYRRLIQMFGTSISDVAPHKFGEVLEKKKKTGNKRALSIAEIKEVIQDFKAILRKVTGMDFPQNPGIQLEIAIKSIFQSWNKHGAVTYRRYNAIPNDIGTAVIIQQMVFGNASRSGSGVYFTRDPNTGSSEPLVEYLDKIQGEDIVGGLHDAEKSSEIPSGKLSSELSEIGSKLERHYQKPQDIEFTIEKGQLWILQTRELRMTGQAALSVAADMLDEEILTENEAVRLIKDSHVKQITQSQIFPIPDLEPFLEGIPASPGASSGNLTLSTEAEKLKNGIFIANHIDPNDLETIYKSNGIITTLGGAASHMAIIMRAAGKPGIVGASDISIDMKKRKITNREGKVVKEGAPITLDGSLGMAFNGNLQITKTPNLNPRAKKLLAFRKKILGNSPWAVAAYKAPKLYRRSMFLKKIQNIIKASKWKSPKSKTMEVLNILFDENTIIRNYLVSPDNTKEMRRLLERSISRGYDPSPRTTHYPEKLFSSPWASGPHKISEIDDFIYGDFPGKYKGFKEWKKDKNLEAVVICEEFPGKVDERNKREHFVFTVSTHLSSPPKVLVSINRYVFHLRSFERAKKGDIILIEASINQDSADYLGAIYVISKGEKYEYTDFVNNIELQKADPDLITIVRQIKRKVFNEWWKPPIALPHMLSALDDAMGLSALEGQGRITNGKIVWCKIYGAKGYEEKEKVRNFRNGER